MHTPQDYAAIHTSGGTWGDYQDDPTKYGWKKGVVVCLQQLIIKACQKNWTQFTVAGALKCLRSTKDKIKDAGSVCRNLGGSVPLPSSLSQNNAYKEAFAKLIKVKMMWFVPLDANDIQKPNEWATASGTKLSYFNWRKQPGYVTSGQKLDYVVMWPNGEWEVKSGDEFSYIICEQ